MRTVIMVAALLGALPSCLSCAGPPTEAEHRAEVEDLLGHPVDWPAWHREAEQRCGLDRAAFERALAERAHGRMWLATEADVRVLCPRRLQEVTDWYRGHGPIR